VVNALEALKSASLGSLDDRRRRDALRRLERLGPPDSTFAARVHDLLADAPSSPPRPPSRARRARTALRARYTAWSHRRNFTVVIDVFFFVLAIGTLGELLGIQLARPGITRPSGKIAVAAASVAGVLIVVGILQLRRDRMAAYRWFDRALVRRGRGTRRDVLT
jgi:hypothetical protein